MVSTIPNALVSCGSASTLRILYSPPEETKSEAKADDGIQTFSIYSDTSVRIKLGVTAVSTQSPLLWYFTLQTQR